MVGDRGELPFVDRVTGRDIDLKIPGFLGGIIFLPAAQYDRLTGLELVETLRTYFIEHHVRIESYLALRLREMPTPRSVRDGRWEGCMNCVAVDGTDRTSHRNS